jgi:hypothetical protein
MNRTSADEVIIQETSPLSTIGATAAAASVAVSVAASVASCAQAGRLAISAAESAPRPASLLR